MKEINDIVLLDLWTDANRGDNCLQSGLIGMARQKWPHSKIRGVFRFGFNEFESAIPEVSDTIGQLDEAIGGLRRTYYSAENFDKFKGLQHAVVSLYSFVEVVLFLALYKLKLKGLIPSKRRNVITMIAGADHVVWKGKNFRDYGGIGGVKRQSTLLVAGVIAITLNKSVSCLNASVWNLRSKVERKMIKYIFSRCKNVSVRDRSSLDNVRELVDSSITNVYFAQDLSFYDLYHRHQCYSIKERAGEPKYDVAITVTEWGGASQKEHYVDLLKCLVANLKENGFSRFVVVPQVTREAESNSWAVDELKNYCSDSLEIISEELSIERLLAIYSKSRLLIGTRMHSCVFAASVNTPFIGIAYDAGPKWDILSEFWPSEFVYTYSSPESEVLNGVIKLLSSDSGDLHVSADQFKKLSDESYFNVGGMK